jgi:mono/diheme cytochrome c family protein
MLNKVRSSNPIREPNDRTPVRRDGSGKVASLKPMLIATGVVLGTIATLIPSHAADRTKEDYLTRCASCHGAEGRGDGPSTSWLRTKPTDFHDCGYMEKVSDDTMFTAIKYGTGMVDLPPDMPGFFNRLSDTEIKSMGAYVRGYCRK